MQPSREKTGLKLALVAVVAGSFALALAPSAATPSQAQAGADSRAGTPTMGAQPGLDFETYRSRVEPIFLKKRPGGMRCYDCHSALSTRFRLEKLEPDRDTWTLGQSRKNFAVVSALVVPSQPLESRLLLHPLAPEAGGDPAHGGGKFWASKSDPEWQTLAEWVRAAPPSASAATSETKQEAALSFDVFKNQVEPIFLKKRTGHARCYGCHVQSSRAFHLVKLSADGEWTEEQSRQNFTSVLQLVVPGNPAASPLLLHPLAPEAGGDAFHSGGRQFDGQNDPDWVTMARWVRGEGKDGADPAATSLIYVTNSAADTIDVIDAATNRVSLAITGIELPHGIAFSPDGSRIYISNESESVLDVVDRPSGAILEKVTLSGRPNNIAITKDGSRVLVGIRNQPGSLDVIDTVSLRREKSIPVDGSVHNVYVTPDGKFAVSGSLENKCATVVDLDRDRAVWEIKFENGVRPMAFETNADGSTARIFVQLSGFHGFAVVDFREHREVTRIKLPDEPGGFGAAEGRLPTPSHGIGVAPDGRSLWVNSTLANATFKYSLPDLKLVGYVKLPEVHGVGGRTSGAVPEWITFTPDSKRVYVSNSAARSVSVIDTTTLERVAVVPVGEVPKRIKTLVLHEH